MDFPRRRTKALEELASPVKKRATANQGLIKLHRSDGLVLYGLWQRDAWDQGPISLIYLNEPGSRSLASLDADPNIHAYTIYQLKDQDLRYYFHKAMINRLIDGQTSLAELLEPIVFSGKFTGDQYLKAIAYLSLIKESTTVDSVSSLDSSTQNYNKIIDRNLQAIQDVLAKKDCSVKVRPQTATNELETILFEPVMP